MSCKYYSETMNSEALEQLVLEGDLRKAVERDEFMLYFQPQVDIRSGGVVGAEALVRWRHPELGLVEPRSFISVAEQNGLIHDIGAQVLRKACMQIREWTDTELGNLRLAVNLSGNQFARRDILEQLGRVLEEEEIDPRRLELELTESVLLREAGNDSLRTLRAIKEFGVRLTLDDFGTGYSSLSYLSRLPVDALKIDRSFLTGLPAAQHNAAIVRAIVAMARSLDLRVVAEGVESEEQLEFLRDVGCHEFQGFLFARPVPASALTQVLTLA